MNIQSKIKELEIKRAKIQEEIDKLEMQGQKEANDFKANLEGRFFQCGSGFIKILKQEDAMRFQILRIDNYDSINDIFSVYITHIYIYDNVTHFRRYKEISETEFYAVFDAVKEKIKQF